MKKINEDAFIDFLRERIDFLIEEPDFDWLNSENKICLNKEGKVDFKVSIANTDLDHDLWNGLRNPAMIGLHPLGLNEIWDYYSSIVFNNFDANGKKTIFPTAKTYDWTKENYQRACIISVMLPLAKKPLSDYMTMINDGHPGPIDYYNKWSDLTTKIMDKAVERTAMDLNSDNRPAIGLTEELTNTISKAALPETKQGKYHGPSKRANFPHKSMAALTGLGQFGINRLILHDEVVDGKVERFIGPVRTIIIFDDQPLDEQLVRFTPAWKDYIFKVNDFRVADDETGAARFCRYNAKNAACHKCVTLCPPNALAYSSPTPHGNYAEKIVSKSDRFYDGFLQFDYDRCNLAHNDLRSLYSEWRCARCLVGCAVEGTTSLTAVENHKAQKKKS